MLGNDSLRERIRSLARARRTAGDGGDPNADGATGDANGAGAAPAGDGTGPARRPDRRDREAARVEERVEVAVGVEEFLPGGEWRDGRGAVYVHERLRSTMERQRTHWGRLDEPPPCEVEIATLARAGLERALFLDLETCGLSASPVFLAGTMQWNGSDFVLRQYFARHYGEEATLIAALHQASRDFEFLITFNGKSYDAPFLRNRALLHGVTLSLPPCHLDLLHAARRRWREELRDCRLQTLERHLCRRMRSGDVPSEEIPGLYHDFVRHGDPFRLLPVFHHNLLDVITMSEILRAVCGPGRRR
jgi:uncharacterized protein YprB with RNaseH-like and TPR domain